MTPSVASVQRLAFFSLRIPDSELGCDVGSARDPIKRGVVRLRSVTFSSSTMHDRDEIWVAKGRRRAGDGDGPDRRRPRQPRAPHQKPHSGPATSRKTALWPRQLRAPHGKAQFGWSEARRMRLSVRTRAQNALFRDVPRPECAFPSRRGAREVWGNPPARLRGTMENASTGQMRSSNPPPGCGVGCAGVRKSRLGVWSHGKAHSEALWPSHLTKNRTLQPVPHQKPHSALAVPPQHGTAPPSPHSSPREWCSKRPFS